MRSFEALYASSRGHYVAVMGSGPTGSTGNTGGGGILGKLIANTQNEQAKQNGDEIREAAQKGCWGLTAQASSRFLYELSLAGSWAITLASA